VDESEQGVLRFVVFNIKLRLVRRTWRILRRVPVLRPYIMLWGLYKGVIAPSRRTFRINMKRGEKLLLERT